MTEPTQRELRSITKHALHRLARHRLTSDEARELATAALAQLNNQARKPGAPDAPDIFRERVQPGLWLALDASHCIVMEVRTADESELIGRVALSDGDRVTEAIGNARAARAVAEEQAGAERWAGLMDAEWGRRLAEGMGPGEDADSRGAAAAALLTAGLPASSAYGVLKRAYGHTGATFNVKGTEQLGTVSYDRDAGTYAVRVPERGCCGMPGTDCTGPCARSQDETGPADAAGLTALVQQLAGGSGDSTS
jgi:hypothetical protein